MEIRNGVPAKSSRSENVQICDSFMQSVHLKQYLSVKHNRIFTHISTLSQQSLEIILFSEITKFCANSQLNQMQSRIPETTLKFIFFKCL